MGKTKIELEEDLARYKYFYEKEKGSHTRLGIAFKLLHKQFENAINELEAVSLAIKVLDDGGYLTAHLDEYFGVVTERIETFILNIKKEINNERRTTENVDQVGNCQSCN